MTHLFFSFLLYSSTMECLLPLLMSQLLAAKCAIWIDVWKGPLYLSVILVGGFMDVSIGRRTLIRHVSSSNGWTRTHAHMAVQRHHLSMKGLRDIRLRHRLQETKGMRLMQGKQKHGMFLG